MAENKKTQQNWPLLLPIGLLIVEGIVVAIMLLTGFTISQYLFYFFILLGVYLIYQIGKQLFILLRVNNAMKKFTEAKHLAETDKPFEAIKAWKRLLLQLPKEKYLEVLSLLEETYQKLGMAKAVQQTKNLHSESIEFFELTSQKEKPSNKERQTWQLRVNEIRKMIINLPEEENNKEK